MHDERSKSLARTGMKDRMEQLLEWATGRGAVWAGALEVKAGARGRGVFCAEAVKSGELLLRLPHSLAVRPLPQIATLVAGGECSGVLGLVLTLIHGLQLHGGPSAATTPFFRDLAETELPGIPAFWLPSERAHLTGTTLDSANAAEDGAKIFERDALPMMERLGAGLFPPQARTLVAFEAALSWVTSRGFRGRVSYEIGHLFPYLAADGPPSREDGPYMLPLVDLVNHTSDPSQLTTVLAKVGGEGRAIGGGDDDAACCCFEMRAARDLQAGEEVLHSYGAHDAADLVRTYGFCDDTAPAFAWSANISREELVRAAGRAPRPSTQSLAAAAAQLFKQDWVPPIFTLRSGSGGDGVGDELALPKYLLSSVQVLSFGEEEFAAWVEAGCIPLGEGYLDDDSISTVVACLTEVASVGLQRYPGEDTVVTAAETAARVSGEVTTQSDRRSLIGATLRARERLLFAMMKKEAVAVYFRYEEALHDEVEDGSQSDCDSAAGGEEDRPSKRQK